jgi:hypothetical protein
MLKSILLVSALAFVAISCACAELKPGEDLEPYEIHNTATNEDYCQMCAYGAKSATIAVYGNLADAAFWTDLEKLQALQKEHPSIGVFGQVLDSKNAAAIQVEAKKRGIVLPVVYAVDRDWNDIYKVNGVSRTVYYSKLFKVAWSNIGLDEKAVAAIREKLKADADAKS